jgi:hypothetical protein
MRDVLGESDLTHLARKRSPSTGSEQVRSKSWVKDQQTILPVRGASLSEANWSCSRGVVGSLQTVSNALEKVLRKDEALWKVAAA